MKLSKICGMEFVTHTHTHSGISRFVRHISVPAATILFTVITVFIMTSLLHAQTEWREQPTTHAVENQLAPSAAQPAQAGFTIVVWEDQRSIGTGYDIYMQKIDSQTGLPMWLEPDGVPVCTESGNQRNPRAAYDSLGGVIITWEDDRNGTTSVYAHRAIVSTGVLDANWPAGGKAICDLYSECEHVRIAGTADGAFITWLDYRNYQNGRGRAVYAQYILSATASWPQSAGQLWVQDGILVNDVIDDGDTEHPEIDRDYIWRVDAGQITKAGCVIAYQNLIEIAGQWYWNVWAANLDADGIKRYDLSLVSGGSDADQLYPRIVCAGKDGTADQARAIVVWQDAREDPNAPLYDIVAQVVDGYGNLQNPGGEIICDEAETQRYPVLTLWERSYDPTTGTPYAPFATIAWEDLRDYAQTRVDIYAGQLDARFIALTNPNGPAGEVITQAASDQTQVAIDMVPWTTTAFIAWRHQNTNPYETDIHYQEVDVEQWQYGKPVGGWPVTEAKDDQQHPDVSGAVMVWEDNRRQTINNDLRSDWDIYCQTPGECVGPAAMNWRDMFAKVTTYSSANTYRMATDDEHNTYIVWDEEREPNAGRQIWVQKFDKTGVPRWTNGGVQVSNIAFPTTSAKLPDVTPDYNGGAQITWQQTTSATGYVDVMYARVLYDGTCSSTDILRIRDEIGGTEEHIEPKIEWIPQTNWGPGAMIALFDSTAGGSRLSRWVVRTILTSPPTFPSNNLGSHQLGNGGNNINYYFGLEIAAHGAGGVHMLTRAEDRSTNPPTFYLNMASIEETSPPTTLTSHQLENQFFTDFGGYDIAVDPLSPIPHSALVAYSIKGPTTFFDIYVERYPGPWMNSGGVQSMPLTAGSTGSEAKQPAICPDLLDVSGQGDGGMLVAWDFLYMSATQVRHKVQTTQVSFPGVPVWIIPPFDVSTELTAPSWPDIALLVDPVAGSDAVGMLVWEGGGETSPCSPPRPTEIYSQVAQYGNIGGNQGVLWNAEEMVSPGPGNYRQLRPTIQRSDGETCTTFWLDGRAGTKNPMGTRIEDLGGQGIGWLKPPAKQVPTGFDVSVYPNPFDRSSAALARVVIKNDVEEYASVQVYDLLGRTLATLHAGTLRTGRVTLHLDASTHLAPGTYFLGVISATRRTVLPLVVVK